MNVVATLCAINLQYYNITMRYFHNVFAASADWQALVELSWTHRTLSKRRYYHFSCKNDKFLAVWHATDVRIAKNAFHQRLLSSFPYESTNKERDASPRWILARAKKPDEGGKADRRGAAVPKGLEKCHGQVRSFVKSREFPAIDTCVYGTTWRDRSGSMSRAI